MARVTCALRTAGQHAISTKGGCRSKTPSAPKTAAAAAAAPEMGGEGFEPPCCFPRDSRPEAKAAQKAAHGAGGAGGEVGADGARGRRDRFWAGWARPRAHAATWRLPGPVARSQRVGAHGGHGSSLTQRHALGPTERLAGTIEFVSGGCHRCHRYRNQRQAPHAARVDQATGYVALEAWTANFARSASSSFGPSMSSRSCRRPSHPCPPSSYPTSRRPFPSKDQTPMNRFPS